MAVIRHGLQDQVAPVGYFLSVGIGIEALRGLDHASQHRCLRHREFKSVRAEVSAGRRFDAIGMVTKRHQVEIVGEDVILIQFRIHLGGHAHLAQLAGHGLLGGRGAFFIGGGRDQQ